MICLPMSQFAWIKAEFTERAAWERAASQIWRMTESSASLPWSTSAREFRVGTFARFLEVTRALLQSRTDSVAPAGAELWVSFPPAGYNRLCPIRTGP